MHPSRRDGAAAELLVAYRFLLAGCPPSWPLLPLSYDLIVDTGEALRRVQVKQAHSIGTGLIWGVRLTKRHPAGDRSCPVNALDYVCVVCKPNHIYVIPAPMLTGATDPTQLVARLQIYETGTRFAAYLNAFAIGPGCGTPYDQPEVSVGWTPHGPKFPHVPSPTARRKHHHRLTLAEVAEVRTLIEQAGNSTATRRQLAKQFDVGEVTIRNLLNGRRKDLLP